MKPIRELRAATTALLSFRFRHCLAFCLTVFFAIALASCRKSGSSDSASSDLAGGVQKITFVTSTPLTPPTVKGGSTTMVMWPVVSQQSMIVSVAASSDNGHTWQTITPYLVNTGMYAFTAPTVESSSYRLKIVGDTEILAESDTFRIISAPPRLSASSFASATGITFAEFKTIAVYSSGAPANPQLSGITWTLDLSTLVETPLGFEVMAPVSNSLRGGIVSCLGKTCTYSGPSAQTAGNSTDDSFMIFLRDEVGNQSSFITVYTDPTYIPSVGGGAGGGSNPNSGGGVLGASQTRPDPTAEPGPAPGTQIVNVATAAEVLTAIAAASPGDEITLAPGAYIFTNNISVTASGTLAKPIYLRAASPGTVILKMQNKEGFVVQGVNDWVFENLKIIGDKTALNSNSAGSPNYNEHCFHIKAPSNRITLRFNDIVNFMSHVKVDAIASDSYAAPSSEIRFIENLFRDSIRIRGNGPFNALNIDGGYNHVARGNRFVDLISDNSTKHTSSLYFKMGTRYALIEKNLVVCQKNLNATNATLKGIYSGDSSPGNYLCPWFEGTQDCYNHHNIYRNNILINCKDSTGNRHGVGVNAEDSSQYLHNTSYNGHTTYLGTWAASDILMAGNILTYSSAGSPWFSPDGNTVQSVGNLMPLTTTAAGYWTAPAIADFTLTGAGAAVIQGQVPRSSDSLDDFCGHPRNPVTSMGAIEYDHPDAATCLNFIKSEYAALPSSL